VIWPILTTLIASGASSGALEFNVRVQNEILVEPRTLAGAHAVVGHIFASSGVRIRWTQDANALRIQILNRQPRNLHDDTIGFSVLIPPGTASYSVVSLPAAMNLAEREDAPLAMVLGVALAHEIGHVMLGSSRHSITGVMSARLDHRQLQMAFAGTLLFTASQSVELRSVAKARNNAGIRPRAAQDWGKDTGTR